jgi:anti-anti-sigma factor
MSELARIQTRRSGPAHVVHVVGEVDLSNAQDLTDAVARDVPDEVTLVVVDLTGTTYVDSAAIATLFRLAARLRDHRQELRLVVPADSPIRAVLELTRLTHVIPVDELPYAALPEPAAPARSVPSPGPDGLPGDVPQSSG